MPHLFGWFTALLIALTGHAHTHTHACAVTAPTTAAGYAAMFAAVPVSEWGGADVSISVPLPDGRSVWLYGDTLSSSRFVHSSAIVQDDGCLHVSHAGAQLLPDDNPSQIYWIEAGRPADGGIEVTARLIQLTGAAAWDFADGGISRTALIGIDAAGDATFTRWTGTLHRPELPASPLTVVGPHHYTYAVHTHPEAHLADGRTLVTTCQNWDDWPHPFADYRPIFTEESTS